MLCGSCTNRLGTIDASASGSALKIRWTPRQPAPPLTGIRCASAARCVARSENSDWSWSGNPIVENWLGMDKSLASGPALSWYSGVKGINALLAVVSTPAAAPVIAATRLRKGSTNSARGAARLVADALVTASRAGVGGLVILRADSAYYNHDVIAAAIGHGARFSVTARMDPAVRRAITAIPETGWTPIHYPNAIWDEDEQRLISDAEVAEIEFTAFTSRPQRQQVTARLIVRRVKRLNPASVPAGQDTLFAAYRHHAVFTDNPMPLLDAETCHRQHAIIEQVIADLKSGPMAHLPSGSFAANSAWLVLAAIAFNLTRAAGCLASTFHARATAATIRRQLISVPARLARSARRLTLHLPTDWPWADDWMQLFDALHAPPQAA